MLFKLVYFYLLTYSLIGSHITCVIYLLSFYNKKTFKTRRPTWQKTWFSRWSYKKLYNFFAWTSNACTVRNLKAHCLIHRCDLSLNKWQVFDLCSAQVLYFLQLPGAILTIITCNMTRQNIWLCKLPEQTAKEVSDKITIRSPGTVFTPSF